MGKADNIPELRLQPVGSAKITEIIRNMNSSHAFGHEGIDTKSLKLVADSIAAPIAHIVNLTISQSTFSNKWKLDRLFPYIREVTRANISQNHFVPFHSYQQSKKLQRK